MPMTRFLPLTMAAGALLVAASAAGAARAQGWVVDLGARVSAGPDYEGADKTKIRAAPTLTIRRAAPAHRFTPPDPGVTLTLLDTQRFSAGPVLLFRREREDTGELMGLRRVKGAAEIGAFVDLWPSDWLRLHLQGRKGVHGHKGWLADAGFDLVYSGTRFDASIGPRIGYASDRFMQTYFGVTPEEAALNPGITTAYDASGGGRYLGARAAFEYYLSDQWRVGVDAGYERLADKAADSPIVRTFGSRDQYAAGASVTYSFGLPFGR